MSKKLEDSIQTSAAKLQSGRCLFPWVMARCCALLFTFCMRATAVCPAFLSLAYCDTWKLRPQLFYMRPNESQMPKCLSFLPHKRVLLLYKWPESHPPGRGLTWGKATAGWRGTGGRGLLYVNARWPSDVFPTSTPKTATEGNLQLNNFQHCTHMLCHARSIQLEGYWLLI